MSKRRDLRQRTFLNNLSMDEKRMKNSASFFGKSEIAKSRYVPSLQKNTSLDLSTTNFYDYHKEKLFNKYSIN